MASKSDMGVITDTLLALTGGVFLLAWVFCGWGKFCRSLENAIDAAFDESP